MHWLEAEKKDKGLFHTFSEHNHIIIYQVKNYILMSFNQLAGSYICKPTDNYGISKIQILNIKQILSKNMHKQWTSLVQNFKNPLIFNLLKIPFLSIYIWSERLYIIRTIKCCSVVIYLVQRNDYTPAEDLI